MLRDRRALNASRHIQRAASTIEALEPRRMLTFVYNGTAGDDDIVVYGVPIGTTVNGNDTPDINIVINLFGGNDRVEILSLPIGRSVTIRGGLGNDSIEVGEGHFANDIDGNIYFEESPNEGADGIVIIDNGDINDHDDTHVTASKVYADETATIDATVHWTTDVESKRLWLNGGEDDVYLHANPSGLNVSLGDGDDTVLYSPDSHVLFGFVTPATISGGLGADRLVFYDDNGGLTGRDYTATDNSVMNQVITGIDDIDLFMREATHSQNTVIFTGMPEVGAINIKDTVSDNTLMSFGTESQRLDLDRSDVLLTVNAGANAPVEVWVQPDHLGIADPYYVFTQSSPAAQRVSHGTFGGIFTDNNLRLSVHASGQNDVFNIAGKRLGTELFIYGDGGNDTVQTVNLGDNNHANDWDEVVPTLTGTAPFSFFGEAGTDTMIFNDSADQTNDDDFAYYVGGSWLAKSNQPGFVSSPKLVAYDDTTELFSVTASAENNTFTFSGHATQSFTINGGFGNDLFQTDTSAGLQNCRASVSISGGNTTDIDTIVVNDGNSAFNAVTEYRFDSNNFSYYSGLTRIGSIGFGGSTENFELYQGSAGTTTRVNVKATAFNLKVLAGAGDDNLHVGGGDFDSNQFTPLNTQLFGEGGNDSIRFDDRADSVTAGESELLSLDSLRVTKGAKALSYNTFESQIVDAGNGTGGANTIELINVGSSMTNTTINGGTTRPTIANIGIGVILGLTTTINMNRVVGDTININDQNDPGNDTYLLTKSSADTGRFVKNFGAAAQTIDFTGASNFTLNGGTDGKGITIRGVIQGMPVTVNAGPGFDTIRLGNGNVDADLLSPVSVNGGAGNDELGFENMQDPTVESQTLDGLTFTDGFSHTANAIESMYVQNGSGGGTFNLLRALVYTNFSSSSFNQTVNIGNGNLDANILANIDIGTAGSVTVDDRLDIGNDGYTVNVTTFQKTTPGARVISMSNVQAAILQANDGDNNIQVVQGLNNLHIFANGGNDHIDVADTVFITTLHAINVHTGAEDAPSPLFGDSIDVNTDSHTAGDVPAKVRLIASDRMRALTVRGGGTIQVPTAATMDLASPLAITLGAGGTIDLAGGGMIVRNFASSINAIRSWAAAGYAGGAWTGTSASGAIHSSLAASSSAPDALGYVKASEISSTFPFDWRGAQVNAGDALVRHTYYGDTDLNGVVNFDDYSRIDNGFVNNRTGWVNGDFNYNNAVNFDDYALIDLAFNTQGAPLRPLVAPSGGQRAPWLL